MKTREEAVRELLDWHQVVDPGLMEVYQFPAQNEQDADEPISLLEVSEGTFRTGHVETFTFHRTEDIPYPLRIATITPEEMRQIRAGQIPLPAGWDLSLAKSMTLPNLTRSWRKSLLRRADGGTSQRRLPAKRLPTSGAKGAG